MMAKRKKKDDAVLGLMMSDDYRAKDDLSTLTRAHEVIADLPRMKSVRAEAARQRAALERIERLEGVNLSGRGRTLREQPALKMAEKGTALNRHPKREGPVEKPGPAVDQSHVGKKR
jgi:hypothetical protein